MRYEEPPEPFTWHQYDAGKLRCERCGAIVQAVVCDIHLAECSGLDQEPSDGESRDGRGGIRPVPPGVDPDP